MFAMFRLCAILALAAPFASALTITSISGNVVSGGQVTVKWTTATTDPAGSFSIYLMHPTFNDALGIANDVDSSTLTDTIALPSVPAQDGYTIEFVDISDVNTVYTVSNDFAIGAESATLSTTVTGASSVPSSKSASATSASGSGSAASSGTPLSTKAAPSASNTGFGVTNSASSTAAAGTGTGASSAPSTSSTGSSGALAAHSILGGSASGALLVAFGIVAGAFAL